MSYTQVAVGVTNGFEAVGMAVLTLGALWAAVRWCSALLQRIGAADAYARLRRDLGRSILLGLEILVAADIIRTIAVEPSLENVVILGLIVLIRTFLSFSLEIEIEGALPWRRAKGA
ncbi:MAG: DUF1622 domain-containing protein [Coriobacteriia bacterium]